MQNFIKHFKRDHRGAWLCVSPADVVLPQGRVQVTPGTVFMRGTKFMNLDLAALLEEEYVRASHPG
jgi:hypothetical protein